MSSRPRGLVLVRGSGTNERGSAVMDQKLAARGWDIDALYTVRGDAPDLQYILDGGYQFFGIDASFWGVSDGDLRLAYQAYNAGVNCMTLGNDTAFSTGNPIWGGRFTISGGPSAQLVPVAPALDTTHFMAQGWTQWNDTDARTYLTNVRPTAVVVGTFTYQGTLQPAIVAEDNPNGNGARYIHNEAYNAPDNYWDRAAEWFSRPGGQAQVFDGNSWVYRPVNVWDGAKWVKRPLKAWDGTTWSNI